MGFTRSIKDLKIIQKLSDYPNMEDGLSAEELKKKFDEGVEEVQKDLNRLQEELEDETSSGNIGALPLSEGDNSEANVQSKLGYLLELMQSMSQGAVADGSITKAKMNTEYANSLAEKNGVLQENLNAEKINGKTLEEITTQYYPYVVGSYTGNGDPEYNTNQTITLDFTPSAILVMRASGSIYASFNTIALAVKNSSYFYRGSTPMLEIVEKGFKVYNQRAGSNIYSELNREDTIYNYIALR